jgi:hypothetical protein
MKIMGWAGVRIPTGKEIFLKTGSEAHPASYSMDAGGSFPGVKSLHLVPSSRTVELHIYSPCLPGIMFN